LFKRKIRKQFTAVSIADREYFANVERLAEIGVAMNYVDGGLIMTVAAKSAADII